MTGAGSVGVGPGAGVGVFVGLGPGRGVFVGRMGVSVGGGGAAVGGTAVGGIAVGLGVGRHDGSNGYSVQYGTGVGGTGVGGTCVGGSRQSQWSQQWPFSVVGSSWAEPT